MKRQHIFGTLLCFFYLCTQLEAKNPPNIIFILADDLGFNDVGFHGSVEIPTPNIDALAYSGVVLNNYYVSPVCTPSRSAIMTGKNPIHTGMQREVVYMMSPWGLPLTERLLPEYLKDVGYATHMVGKWHLGHCKKEYTPTYRGFDSHLGYLVGVIDYYNHISFHGGSWGYDFWRNLAVNRDGLNHYSTDLFADEAVSIIRQHDASRPLFLYLAHLAVHSTNWYETLAAPPEIVEKFNSIEDKNRRIFAAMVYKMDESVGRVVAALDEAGLLQNSIIVFSSDNGGPAAGFNSNAASNWPLRGVKNTTWEGGVRGAGLIWSPLLNKTERVSSQMMAVEDWLPTLYQAAGGAVEDLGDIDGVSMWEALSEDLTSPRTEVLHCIDEFTNTAAVRKGDWKLIDGMTYDNSWSGWYGPSGRNDSAEEDNIVAHKSLSEANIVKKVLHKNGIRIPENLQSFKETAEVKCGEKPENATNDCNPIEKPCLYNIAEDPCEYRNLADERPDILADLQELLQKYNSTAVPPNYKDDDPTADAKYYNHFWVPWMDVEYEHQRPKPTV